MDTFVEEVSAVREGLGLDRIHLLGHSWGGWLALEYTLRRPELATCIIRVIRFFRYGIKGYAAPRRRITPHERSGKVYRHPMEFEPGPVGDYARELVSLQGWSCA
jgi:pimeloyl-ACP methyl ester carboxylesterase